MNDIQRLLEIHLAAARTREAALKALGLSINIPGNGLATSFKKSWQAACEAEAAVHRRILRDRHPVIPYRGKKR